ncbi:MAG: hypothetical protein GEU93_09795 [Propionibacteriales bacterium]|nr:hypothetical protein [Propionibacteriales bacterium]
MAGDQKPSEAASGPSDTVPPTEPVPPPEPVPGPEPTPPPEPTPGPDPVLPPEPTPDPWPEPTPDPRPAPQPTPPPAPAPGPPPVPPFDSASSGDSERVSSGGLSDRLPALPGPLGAAAVGIMVALLGRVLILVGEEGCDAARGTSSCGGWGVLMLLVIAGVMLYVGLRLHRMLDIREAAVANFFGLALFVIVVLGLLIDDVFDTAMWAVLPLVAAVTYAVGAWIAVLLAKAGSEP